MASGAGRGGGGRGGGAGGEWGKERELEEARRKLSNAVRTGSDAGRGAGGPGGSAAREGAPLSWHGKGGGGELEEEALPGKERRSCAHLLMALSSQPAQGRAPL